jgi:peroxiredoxin Q/BCP
MARTLLLSVVAVSLVAGSLAADDAVPDEPQKTAELHEGDALPAFESLDDHGQPWKSSDHVGMRVLLLYFYPGDFTGGCSKQAQAFRDALAKLEELDVEVVGVSGDEVATHQLFKESHGLRHTLLADPQGALAQRLGMPVKPGAKVRTRDAQGKPLMDEKVKSIIVRRNVTLPRWTMVVGRDGTLVSLRTNVDPVKDADEVLRIVEDVVNEAR